ncbi:MAG: tail fiber domain-containing protein [Dechloromonas sp.]|nr:tail fiber domain-containing protein [Dechloromonas sp.]
MTYNTGNPLGSTDARDLSDNAANLDKAMHSEAATWTDRFGVARPTFRSAESELNQKVEDAEAAATQALGYLNTMRATSYGPLAEDPTVDPLGNPCTAGDEYFNTTYNLLKRFDGLLWRVPDINTENLSSGAGSSMVGHGSQTVEAALAERLPEIGTYALLRAYTGPVTSFLVRGVANIFDGGHGVFRVDPSDTTSTDNGGTILVDASGRRWKRDFSGAVSVLWFGASTAASASANVIAIQAAADYCASAGHKIAGAAGVFAASATISLNCSGDLSMMTISVPGSSITPAIRVGKTTGGHTMNIDIKLPRVVNAEHVVGDGWATYASNIGVSLDNLYDSVVYVPSVTGFGIGAYAGGVDAGFGANEVHTGYLADNKVNLKIGPKGAGAWSNGNTYHIGRCRHSGSEGNGGTPFAGTRNIVLDQCNDNVLIKPTIEGSSAVTEFTLELYNASYNTFIQPRWEDSASSGGSKMKVRMQGTIANSCAGNTIIGGYEFGTSLEYTFAGYVSNNTKFGAGRGDQSFGCQNPIAINNTSGDGVAQAHFQGFAAATNILGKSATATDYTYRIYANGIEGKRSTDENPRIRINWSTAGIQLGAGTTNALTYGIYAFATIGLATNSDWMPQTTGTYNIGLSSYRWNNCYLVNAPNVSSDARTKQQVRDLSKAEHRVAVRCKSLIRAYKLNTSVSEKGDAARWHVGVIAQDVKAAFEAEGLDPCKYSLFCFDSWVAQPEQLDDEGNVIAAATAAGEMYSIRYEELLAFIVAAI